MSKKVERTQYRHVPARCAILRSRALLVCVLLIVAAAASAEAPPRPEHGAVNGDRHRAIVSTDIGGSDPDDYQSMVHFLIYADLFDVEGLVSSPPKQGRAEHIHETIDAYAKDYPNLAQWSPRYPSPETLHAVVKQGAIDPAPAEGFGQPTEGSQWIAARAKADDPRPLYVLVWGSITDIAQAVHDDPSIKDNLRVYAIGSWNTANDRAAREYLFREHADLWWIESDTTFRGMYVGGNQEGEWSNEGFLETHVRGHGALGDFLVAKLGAIKMGDTPSLLYLLAGNADDPTGLHWGGSFIKTDHGPHYWTDSKDPELQEGKYPGAKTVNVWREQFLLDWRDRMDRTTAKK